MEIHCHFSTIYRSKNQYLISDTAVVDTPVPLLALVFTWAPVPAPTIMEL